MWGNMGGETTGSDTAVQGGSHTTHLFCWRNPSVKGRPSNGPAPHMTECKTGRGELFAAGGWKCLGISSQGDLTSEASSVPAAECTAIKEVFEFGLMVPFCFEVTVY